MHCKGCYRKREYAKEGRVTRLSEGLLVVPLALEMKDTQMAEKSYISTCHT